MPLPCPNRDLIAIWCCLFDITRAAITGCQNMTAPARLPEKLTLHRMSMI